MPKSTNLPSRVVALLWVISQENTALSLGEIARRSGLPVSTVHRLLGQLAQVGIVARGPHRLYRAGPEFYLLSSLLASKVQIVERAQPLMHEAVRRYDAACVLGLYLPSRQTRVVISRLDPVQPVARRFKLREDISLACGAGGRAILSALDTKTLQATLRGLSVGRMPSPDRTRLLADLDKIRSDGYSAGYGDVLPQNAGIAVPLVGQSGEVFGNISLINRRSRWNPAVERSAADFLMTQAKQLATMFRAQAQALPTA